MLTKSEFTKGLMALVITLVATAAQAWQPKGTVNVIFPNGPGAGNEISFRFLANIVEQNNPGLKFQPQHMPGADGNIAINHLFTKVATDGQTIAIPACQSAWVTPEIWYNSKHDMMQAVHVTHIARSPLAVWAHPSSKINTPKELIDAIKKKDRQINIAIGILLNLIFVFIVLKSTNWLERKLGKTGVDVLRRIFGIILLSIAVKIFKTNAFPLAGG